MMGNKGRTSERRDLGRTSHGNARYRRYAKGLEVRAARRANKTAGRDGW